MAFLLVNFSYIAFGYMYYGITYREGLANIFRHKFEQNINEKNS